MGMIQNHPDSGNPEVMIKGMPTSVQMTWFSQERQQDYGGKQAAQPGY